MKQSLFCLAFLFLCSCSSNPYGTGSKRGSFLNEATISSNVPNVCSATQHQYAFMIEQYWLAGGAAMTSYSCEVIPNVSLQPEYMIEYSIIKNDGTGKNIITKCTPHFNGSGSNLHFTKMNILVNLGKGSPTCEAILSQ